MNPIEIAGQRLGDAINGIFQVVIDFLNLLADILPNPDPFPGMIEQIPDGQLYDFGFAAYWLDVIISIDFLWSAITVFYIAMAAGMAFAVAYWGIKAIKP